MHSVLVPAEAGRASTRHLAFPRLPSRRHIGRAVLVIVALVLVSGVLGTASHLDLPRPTGLYGVGRVTSRIQDPVRVEVPARGGGPRVVSLVAWYPGVADTGSPAAYVPDLPVIQDGLEASGELGPFVAGLGLVGPASRDGADLASTGGTYPVVLLDPGNATNVAFYAALAEDLASRGYAVIGVDHPYQSAAVDVGGGTVAVYREETRMGDGGASIAVKIDERVADLQLVLDRLATDGAGLPGLEGRLDLWRVAVVGHSNGGLAAVAMCGADVRVDACVNIDGQQLGGPFAPTADRATAPVKPFLYLTKEREIAPVSRALFAAGLADTYRVVVPVATHDAFTDGARLRPRLLPFDTDADAVLATERQVVATFVDRYLRPDGAAPFSVFDPPADVTIEIYPRT